MTDGEIATDADGIRIGRDPLATERYGRSRRLRRTLISWRCSADRTEIVSGRRTGGPMLLAHGRPTAVRSRHSDIGGVCRCPT